MSIKAKAQLDVIPVSVLSGFLGSGKTTFLNSILTDDRFKDTVVIVNEFGDVAIDHELIETALDDPILLKNGCICCSIRGDLRDTLLTLISRRRLGQVPGFSRVVVETSGVADPGPVLQELLDDAELLQNFKLSGLLVTVDALNVAGHVSQFDEVERQIALADCLLVTKSDLATDEQTRATKSLVRQINPTASIHDLRHDQSDADDLLQAARKNVDMSPVSGSVRASHDDAKRRFTSYIVRSSEPVEWERVAAWIQSLLSLREGILRVKGFVRVKKTDGPIVLHCVEKTLYPPTILERWPYDVPETRLVFITNNDRLADVQKAWDAIMH